MDYKKANNIKVDGNGNINLQDVRGRDITINYNDSNEIKKLISSANEKLLANIQEQLAQKKLRKTEVFNNINKELLLRKRKNKIQKIIIVASALVIIIISAIAYTNYMQDFSLSIKLISIQDAQISEGKLSLKFADRSFSAQSTQQGEFFFKNVPAKYKNEYYSLEFVHPTMNLAFPDTSLSAKANANYEIAVLYKDIDNIHGGIYDEDNIPVKDVIITVAEQKTTTAIDGRFEIQIPIEKQQLEQRVTAFKEGYQLYDKTITIDSETQTNIILRQ